MKQRVPVSQIMSKTLIVAYPSKKISEINQMFKEYGIRHIPVVKGTKLIGLISKTDIYKLGYGINENHEEELNAAYDTHNLVDVMIKNPITVSADTSIKEVAELLSKQSFHSLPVVEKDELVGIVTTTDLIKYLLEQY